MINSMDCTEAQVAALHYAGRRPIDWGRVIVAVFVFSATILCCLALAAAQGLF